MLQISWHVCNIFEMSDCVCDNSCANISIRSQIGKSGADKSILTSYTEGRRANTDQRVYIPLVSQIQSLTSKITQVCQDIHDIKLRCLLVTQSERESDDITTNILTNWNDCKDTLDSDRSRPETPGIHEGRAEDGNNYIYSTPNRHEHNNQDILQHHDTYQPLWPREPSETPAKPLHTQILLKPLKSLHHF